MKQQISTAKDVNETMDLLRPVALFFFVLYFFLTFSHFFLLPESFKWVMFSAALVTSIVSFVCWRIAYRFSSAMQSLIILLLLLLGGANCLLHLWFSEAPEQTTNIFVAIIASGIALSNRMHWLISILFNWMGWLMVSLTIEMALIQHFFFAMAMSTLLSWFAHLARRNLVAKQYELLRERDLAIQHEQEAKVATEVKSAFLANMSHEIRTPMNGIIGMIELVSRSQLNDVQKEFVATAKRSADSLMVIINDILDFSKIEAGELIIEKLEFDIEQLFTEVINDQQFLATKKGLKLDVVQSELQCARVMGDPFRITQVLNNLVSNAIKFTESGSIIVCYGVSEDTQGIRLNVEVSDTGIGIRDTVIPSLFESFSQGDTSTTRRFGGTGLGLAITKQLCGLMGGNITVDSWLGRGSVFKFTVKLAPATLVVRPVEETPAPPSPSSPIANLANLCVLLVEDNAINQEVMLAILEELEIKVSVVSDGLEALNTLADSDREIFDIVLMDCQMPNMDGYEATRRIRGGDVGEHFSQIPIIALTANTMKGERERCLEVGMNAYLSKPINIDCLKATLAKYSTL